MEIDEIESLTTEAIAAMSSQDRISIINDLRARQLRGDELTDDTLRTAIRLLRAERVARVGAAKGAKKEVIKEPGILDELGL